MADYISREAALADFEQCNRKNSTWTPQRVKTLLMRIPAADVEPVRHGKWNIRLADEITLCVMMINQADTVDAVPVVRCRDCIAFEEIGKYPTNKGGTPFGYCYHWQYEQGMSPNQVDGNDFCSHGERRKSNENHTLAHGSGTGTG